MSSRQMLIGLLLFVLALQVRADGVAVEFDALEQRTGVTGGIAVIVDDSAELAFSLAETGNFVVHLLAARDKLETLRAQVAQRNLGGRVVVGVLSDGRQLPHPDRFANLVVVDRRLGVPEKEASAFTPMST